MAPCHSLCEDLVVAVSSALVLGAGGQLGSAFVRALLAKGARVTAVVRREHPRVLVGVRVPLTRLNTAAVPAWSAPSDPDHLARIARDHDLLIDAAAPYPITLSAPAGTPPAAL